MWEGIEIGIKIITLLFELYVKTCFFDLLFCKQTKNIHLFKLSVLASMTVTLMVDYCFPYVWLNFLSSLFLTWFLVCCYPASNKKRIIATAIANILLALSEVFAAIVLGIGGFQFLSLAANDKTSGFLLSRVVFWGIYRLLKRFWHKNPNIEIPKKISFLGLVLMVILLMEIMLAYSQKKLNKTYASIWFLGASLTCYLYLYLYGMISGFMAEKMKRELAEKEKEYYHREAQLLQNNYNETKKFRHDFKNRMQIINQLAEENKIEELKKYLGKFSEKLEHIPNFSNTGNLVIDSIVNYKLQQAKSQDIGITAHILLPEQLNMDDDDIALILGNLLDNAIEAAGHIKDKKYIVLDINYQFGCIYIHIENKFDSILRLEDGILKTRKSNENFHGIGLGTVHGLVNKYHGTIEISAKEDVFSVDILLYLSVHSLDNPNMPIRP